MEQVNQSGHGLFRPEVAGARRQRLYGDIVLSEHKISSRFVMGIGALCVVTGFWATTAKYPRTERIPGMVTTKLPPTKIFALRPGVVENILVKDGMYVRRGQKIAFIDVDMQDDKSRGAAKASIAALSHQTDGIKLQIAANRGVKNAELHKLLDQVASVRSQITSIRNQIAIEKSIISSKNNELLRISPIAQNGFISQNEVDKIKRDLLQDEQQQQQLEQQLIVLNGDLSASNAQIARLPFENAREQAELAGQLDSVAQQSARTNVDVGYTITAPVDGYVTAVQVAAGHAVDVKFPLLTIVPRNPTFEAKVYPPSRAVGFLRAGQEVKVSFDAFPFKQFGTFSGRISTISKSAYTPAEIDAPLRLEEGVFPVGIELKNEPSKAFGGPLPLQAGMTLTATVILEERSFIDWLLQPLNSVRKRT